MTEKCTVHGYVSGHVQGVWFRKFTKDRALANDVKGWAKNLNDGRVELMLSGDVDNVDQVISDLHVGPPMAVVNNVDVSVIEYQALTTFTIT